MAVSTALEALSTVVGRLEETDATVNKVTVCEQAIGTESELTAELTVAVPLFGASKLRDDITIEAENADLRDQQVSIELTVTVPATGKRPDEAATELSEHTPTGAESETTPAYKDPDALATAYAECGPSRVSLVFARFKLCLCKSFTRNSKTDWSRPVSPVSPRYTQR